MRDQFLAGPGLRARHRTAIARTGFIRPPSPAWPLSQFGVVRHLGLGVEQAVPGSCKLVENPLANLSLRDRQQGIDMGHSSCGGLGDHRRIRLKEVDAQEPVVVRRLLTRRNVEPSCVGVEIVCHAADLSFTGPGQWTWMGRHVEPPASPARFAVRETTWQPPIAPMYHCRWALSTRGQPRTRKGPAAQAGPGSDPRQSQGRL